jgi:hypothetical protein
MIEYSQYIVLFGAVIVLIGTFSYIKETIKGNVKPNRISWLLWSIAPMIATGAAISTGVTWAVLPVFMSGFAPFLVFIASFVNKNSYWKLQDNDYLCGFLSIIALIVWGFAKEPNIAIILAIISDGLAAAPTLIKIWKYPKTENVNAYAAGLFSALTSFFAVKIWNFPSYAFPTYLIVLNICFVISYYRGKFLKDE